jgi:hypothetical protein
MLLLLAVGEALGRRDTFLNFLQNFAYYKHRWGAELVEVVNLQLIRKLSPHAARASAGELQRWWQARKAARAGVEVPPVLAQTKDHAESSVFAGIAVDSERARQLTASARASAGRGMRVLDRAAAREYLPFALE